MFDSLKMSVRDCFRRGHTGGELPMGSLPSTDDPFCVRRSQDALPKNCQECQFGAGGNVDPDMKVACGHPDCPEGARFPMVMTLARVGRQPWCPLTTGRFDGGCS